MGEAFWSRVSPPPPLVPTPHPGLWWNFAWSELVQIITAAGILCAITIMSRSQHLINVFSLHTAPYVPFFASSMMLLGPCMMSDWYMWSIYNRTLIVIYTWHFDKCESLHWYTAKKKLLRPKLRATKICEYTHKYTDCSLTAWSFNKTAVGFPLGPIIFTVMGFTLGLYSRHEITPMEQASYSVRKWLIMSINIMPWLYH